MIVVTHTRRVITEESEARSRRDLMHLRLMLVAVVTLPLLLFAAMALVLVLN